MVFQFQKKKTFLVDELSLNIMEDSIKIIETEFSVLNLKQNVNDAVMKIERQKGMTQTSSKVQGVFSRVQANPCFTSPLFIDQKQIIIPSIAKVSFIQGFINRLRNKVSRVDLLSSGFGFVISVNDLEDCIQYLNKIILQFGEKEIKKRIDSSQYLYDLQSSKIKSQTKQIEAFKQKIKMMKNNQNKHIDALVHERGNNLIYEMGKMQRKQADFQRFLTNVENDVAQEVRKEMNSDLLKLENDKQILRNQFTEFKRLLTVTFTHEIKTSGREMESAMNKKTIDVLNHLNKLQSFILDGSEQNSPTKKMISHRNSTEIRSPSSSIKSSPKEFSQISQIPYNLGSNSIIQMGQQQHRTSINNARNSNYNVSKCGPNEDLLTDPVITTKYINKLRIFYLIKISTMKDKYESVINQQKLELMNYKSLHNELVENKKEENIIKKELVNIHNALKEQEKQNKKLTNELEIITFEKLKIEKNRDDLMKKVRQLDDQIKYIDKYDGLGEDVQNMIKERDEKITKLNDKQKVMQKTVNTIHHSNKKQLKSLEEKIKNETNIKNIMITKLETQNSSTFPNINYLPQYPEATWQSKCQEMHVNMKEVEYENEQLIGLLNVFANEVKDSPNMILNQVLLNLYEKVQMIIQQKKQVIQLKNSIDCKNDLDQQLDNVLQAMTKMKTDKQISLDLLNASDIRSKLKITGAQVSPFNPLSPINPKYSFNRKHLSTQPDEDRNSQSKQFKNISQDFSLLYQNKRSQSRNESPINRLPNQLRQQSSQTRQGPSTTSGGNRNRIASSLTQKQVSQFDAFNKTTYQ